MTVIEGQPNAKRPRPVSLSLESSFDIFMSFVRVTNGQVDCSRLLSSKCYKRWLRTRLREPRKPPESFRRAITAHCRGEDGRRPFPPEVEKSLLKVMRKKRIWSCFRKTDVRIGSRGYQAVGYWEKQRTKREEELKKKEAERIRNSVIESPHSSTLPSPIKTEDDEASVRKKEQQIDMLVRLGIKTDTQPLAQKADSAEAADWLYQQADFLDKMTTLTAFSNAQQQQQLNNPNEDLMFDDRLGGSYKESDLDEFFFETLRENYSW
mmetsp:Transcript_18459/g.22484  ORF Transcript_18459/g.22484 Transcript_18459/m.22484 type:complete len:265 (-) Transcript_18459:953-1747(-)